MKSAHIKATRPSPTRSDASPAASPQVFWVSGPARPDDAVMIVGHGLRDATVEVAALQEADPAEPGKSECDVDPESVKWTSVEPIAREDASLTLALPADLPAGLMLCRMRCGDTSALVTINAPEAWWTLGDAGQTCTPGGWLRIHGRCLGMGASPRVAMRRGPGEPWHVLPCKALDAYALRVELPEPLPAGDYQLCVHNGWGGSVGWRTAPTVCVTDALPQSSHVIDITTLGVEPNTGKDCTSLIVRALERLHALGGGVLYFPRGRYRINGGLRSGMWIAHSLRIPPNVTLRGESMETVSLYWPDREEPLPSLIEGDNHFTVEEMTLYCQGRHRNVISGRGNVRIRRVRIRANCYLHLDAPGRPHRGRNVTEAHNQMGTAIELEGDNVEVTDCDILHSAVAVKLRNVRGALIARNRIRHGQCYFMSYGGERVVFEHNRCAGVHLCATGASVALFFGATTCQHHYIAHNHMAHLYGGDRETVTLDGHGTAYAGGVIRVNGLSVELAADPTYTHRGRDAMSDPYDMTLYVLSGRGAGQYRRVTSVRGREIEIDRPWQVEPDHTSLVSLGALNQRHLFIGNTVEDSGALIQLYPPNVECIVAENIGRRTSTVTAWGKLGLNMQSGQRRVEPSWFHQFIDNCVEEGNAWGDSEGGVRLFGEQVRYTINAEGGDDEHPLRASDLAAVLNCSVAEAAKVGISRWLLVRGQRIDNNGTIRVHGAVTEAVIDHPVIRCSDRGVTIERGPQDLEAADADVADFGRPRSIVIRRPQFEKVTRPLTGSGLDSAGIQQC